MRSLAIAAGLLALGSVQAHAQSAQVTFSDLQSVIPTEDAGVCQTPYGDGYQTSPHSNKAVHHRVSDAGHTIHIKKSDVSLHHGVLVMNNTYDVTFDGADVNGTEAHVYATGLSKADGFAGVFTDGRCKGKITITPK